MIDRLQSDLRASVLVNGNKVSAANMSTNDGPGTTKHGENDEVTDG